MLKIEQKDYKVIMAQVMYMNNIPSEYLGQLYNTKHHCCHNNQDFDNYYDHQGRNLENRSDNAHA